MFEIILQLHLPAVLRYLFVVLAVAYHLSIIANAVSDNMKMLVTGINMRNSYVLVVFKPMSLAHSLAISISFDFSNLSSGAKLKVICSTGFCTF